MHIKRRGQRAMLYRSRWVAKGAQGNSHGYSVQTFIGSLPIDATSAPEELLSRVTPDELLFVEKRILQPARLAAEREGRVAAARAKDPVWRVDDALRLLQEVVSLSATSAVPVSRIKAVRDTLGAINAYPRQPETSKIEKDPLRDAVLSLDAAAKFVTEGGYGIAPAGASRKSQVYENWQAIVRHVEGGDSGDVSLLRALQSKGWVKTRA